MKKEIRFEVLGLHGELTWFTWSFGLSAAFGTHDRAVCLGLRIGLLSLYISGGSWKWCNRIQAATKRRDEKYGNGREFTVYWFEDGLWFALWEDPMESRQADPWYMKMRVIRPLDILLGRPSYESRQLEQVRAVVPMPEGGYPALVTLNEDSWKRPRWPIAKKIRRAEVKPDTPIPFPGKGENAWDCGEDATHSIYCCASTPLEAVMKLSETAMNNRLRYGGGWDYKPEAKTV